MPELPPPQASIARAVERMPVGFAIVKDGLFAYVNPALCEIVGHPQAGLVGRDAFAFVLPEQQEAVRRRNAERQRGAPVPLQYETVVVAADGGLRRVELEPRLIGENETLLTVRALGERAQDRDLLTALGALQARVQRERSVAAVLDVAVKGLLQLGFDACVGQRMGADCIMVASAFHPEVEQLVRKIFVPSPNGPLIPISRLPVTGAAMDLGQPFFRDDASDALARLAQKAGADATTVSRLREQVQALHASISPLTVRGHGWGVLMALAPGVRSNDAAALALFASQVASSIEVAQNIENLETIHDIALLGSELSAKALMEKILPVIRRATQSDTAAILLLDPDGETLRLAGATFDGAAADILATLPVRGTLTGTVVTERRARAFSVTELPPAARAGANASGLLEGAVIPLSVDDRIGGTLHLGRTRAIRYTEAEMRAAEMLSTQVALQLERARLYGEARRRVEDLSLINEVGAAISRHLNLDEVFAVAVRHLTRLADVQNTFVLLLDESGMLEMAATNEANRGLSLRLPVTAQSAAAETVRTGQPVLITDTERDDRAARELARRFGHRALLATPIISQGRAIGSIVLGDTRGVRRWETDEVQRAVEVSNQLGTAIVNARLFEDLKRSYEELRRTQEELVKRERLAALGELSAQVAHEVRNPLGVIFNSVATLKRLQPQPGAARQLLDVLQEESERLNRMVSDLLDFAGPSSARVRPERLEQVLSGALEAAASTIPSEHVKLELTVSEDLPSVPVDAQMLRQAVVNLVVNAIQAMPAGGVVRILAAEEERRGQRVARLDVHDNGPGMPEAVAARAFEPFFTTRAAGTGLGLAVVKRIAEAHGGEVAISSEEGRGSTFTLRIPLAPPPSASP